MHFHTIPAVYDKNSRILILGSFPSVASRKAEFFYAHPQNRFWRVLSSVLDIPLPNTVEEKKTMLLKNNIALWDVIKSCEISGSQDASIKKVEANDIEFILKNSSIKKIYANGKSAYSLYKKHIFPKIGSDIEYLPSTSAANASFSLDKLIEYWSVIKL